MTTSCRLSIPVTPGPAQRACADVAVSLSRGPARAGSGISIIVARVESAASAAPVPAIRRRRCRSRSRAGRDGMASVDIATSLHGLKRRPLRGESARVETTTGH